MKKAEINKAIAEACGWQPKYCGHWADPRGKTCEGVPNFAGSLDAMAEARKTLTPQEMTEYGMALIDIINHSARQADGFDGYWFDVANATSAQHAEAFCKAKGIWKD